jgi:hypothetical protein
VYACLGHEGHNALACIDDLGSIPIGADKRQAKPHNLVVGSLFQVNLKEQDSSL